MKSLMLMDYDFTLRGEIAQFVSLQIKRMYWEVGSFKLTLKRGMPCWDELKRDRILYFPDRPELALLIEKVTLDEDKAVADGVPLKGLCKRRVCVPPQVSASDDQYLAFGWDRFTGSAESAYLHYAAGNLTAPQDVKRALPRLTLAEDQERGEALPWQARFDKLHELFADIGEATGVGWDIRPDFENKRYVFGAWVGADRTQGTARATLSRRLGNVDGTTLTDNGSAEVSTIYAGGSGEDENRLILSVGSECEGVARREGWAEMSGVEDIDMLRLGARRKLVAAKLTLDVDVRDSGLCRYGRDYDVGDVVTVVAEGGGVAEAEGGRSPTRVEDSAAGAPQTRSHDVAAGGGVAEASMPSRLIAMQETYEKGALKLKATFGDAPVTLTKLLRGSGKATENTVTASAAAPESLSNEELAGMLV